MNFIHGEFTEKTQKMKHFREVDIKHDQSKNKYFHGTFVWRTSYLNVIDFTQNLNRVNTLWWFHEKNDAFQVAMFCTIRIQSISRKQKYCQNCGWLWLFITRTINFVLSKCIGVEITFCNKGHVLYSQFLCENATFWWRNMPFRIPVHL